VVEKSDKPRKIFVDSVEQQAGYLEEKANPDSDDESGDDDDKPVSEPLRALKRRERELTTALRELEMQRARMSNSIGGTNKDNVKYKVRARKR